MYRAIDLVFSPQFMKDAVLTCFLSDFTCYLVREPESEQKGVPVIVLLVCHDSDLNFEDNARRQLASLENCRSFSSALSKYWKCQFLVYVIWKHPRVEVSDQRSTSIVQGGMLAYICMASGLELTLFGPTVWACNAGSQNKTCLQSPWLWAKAMVLIDWGH